MPFNGNTIKTEGDLEKGEVDAKNSHQSNDQLTADQILPLQHKRIRFAGSPGEMLNTEPIWQGKGGGGDDELGVSRPGQDPNCILLYPVGKLAADGDIFYPTQTPDWNGNGYARQVEARPQVIIDLGKFSGTMDGSLNFPPVMGSRSGGVIVAAASSSSIGDLSINDNFASVTVEKLVKDGAMSRTTGHEPPGLLSVTATESTSENLVSSTSGRAATRCGILGIGKRTGRLESAMVETSFIPTGYPRYLDCPPTYILGPSRDNSSGRRNLSLPRDNWITASLPFLVGKDPIENGNSLVSYKSLETEEGGEEEEDDDSAGLTVKDETDSAEEDPESEEELTDSASENEGKGGNESRRLSKPVITISDQNFPRLVIDFGDEQVLEEGSTNCQQDPEGNSSILGSSRSQIQNWVENAQRHNKRKRMDSEVLEEKP